MNKDNVMYKTIFAFILFLIFSIAVVAQETKDDLTRLQNGEDLNVQYRNEHSFGAYIHSAIGIGLAYRRGYHVSGTSKRVYELEMQNFKHPKELKNITSFISSNTNGYFYGKLNSVLLFRGGIGYQNILFKKHEKKNIEVRYIMFGGITAAFAKPAYLIIIDSINPQIQTQEKYDPAIHNQNNIYGRAPFFKGIGDTKLYPAGYAKIGLSFDYADRYDGVKAIETGLIMDVYPKAIPFMAFNRNKNVLFSVYLKMIWGKKWF